MYNITVEASDTFVDPATLAVTVTVTDEVGDAIPQISANVTTDDTTFDSANLIESFEYLDLIRANENVTLTGVFADTNLTSWNDLEDRAETARIGARSVSTCEIGDGNCDAPTGEILISNINVTAGSITFLMSGGNGGGANVGVEIQNATDGSVLGTYTPNSCGDPVLKGDQHYVHFDTSAVIGQNVNLRIYDNEPGGCGFIAFDHFYQTNTPRGTTAATISLPLPATNVTKEAAADTGLIPGASFENPTDMVNNRG